MKVYRIQHIPTQLYFQPSRGGSNLSKTGKLYARKPTLSNIPTAIRIRYWSTSGKLSDTFTLINQHFKVHDDSQGEPWISVDCNVKVPQSHWVIKEVCE